MTEPVAFDAARADALYARGVPNPLPERAILVVGADWCRDTMRSIQQNDYATQTRDGRPIYYLNDADPAAHAILSRLPGASVLGGGFDSATPPERPTRQYNYPTVLNITNGCITGVLYADVVPANGLTAPETLEVAQSVREQHSVQNGTGATRLLADAADTLILPAYLTQSHRSV